MKYSNYYNFFKRYNIKLNINSDLYLKENLLKYSDEISLIENLKSGGYTLGYNNQKEIEKKLNSFSWVNSYSMITDISLRNIRFMFITDGFVFYTNDVYSFNHTPSIINFEDFETDALNSEFIFQDIIKKYHNVNTFKNKFISIFYKLFNKSKDYNYDKLVLIYLESYKEGLLNYLKGNDERYEQMSSYLEDDMLREQFLNNGKNEEFCIECKI